MSVSCITSAECDEVQDARQLFDIVSILCSIFFGIPLALVLLRMVTNLSDPIASVAYIQMGLNTDILFSAILAASTFIPMAYTCIRYHRKVEILKSVAQ
jgi:hypothetical protein